MLIKPLKNAQHFYNNNKKNKTDYQYNNKYNKNYVIDLI